jgi:hypothetical protein
VEIESETIASYFYLAKRVICHDVRMVLDWFKSIDVVSAREIQVEQDDLKVGGWEVKGEKSTVVRLSTRSTSENCWNECVVCCVVCRESTSSREQQPGRGEGEATRRKRDEVSQSFG